MVSLAVVGGVASWNGEETAASCYLLGRRTPTGYHGPEEIASIFCVLIFLAGAADARLEYLCF